MHQASMESQCDLVFESLNDVLLLGIKKKSDCFFIGITEKIAIHRAVFLENIQKCLENEHRCNMSLI